MKESLGLTAAQVISQNLNVAILIAITTLISACLAKKYHPIKIAKMNVILFCIILPFIPYLFSQVSNLFSLCCLQFIIFSLSFNAFNVEMACFKYLPVARRFTILATTFGAAGALAYTVVSFSLIPLTKYLEHYAILVIFIPIVFCFFYSINYMEKLEKKSGRYFNYPDEDNPEYPDPSSPDSKQKYDFDEKEAYAAYNAACGYSRNLLNIISGQARRQNKKPNIQLIEKAIIFAKKWHDGQLRDSGKPFYSHTLAMAGIVAECYCKTDVIVAAILHDVVEDTDCTLELIEKEFNKRIAEIVHKLTRVRVLGGSTVKLTLEEMIKELKDDPEALLIKQVDRLHNLDTVGNRHQEKQIKVAAERVRDYLMTSSAYAADKLNISDKFILEDRIFQHCRRILAMYRQKYNQRNG